ncbi:hypothetical protein OB13_15425 [Pontibacter sp. HJ8]
MPNLKLLLLCLSALAPTLLWAQEPTQPVRLELAYESEYNHLEVLPVPDSSLLVYIKTSDGWGTEATFTINKYDSRLERIWSTSLELQPELEYIRHFTEAPYTYLVFQSVKPEYFVFLRINLANGAARQTEHKLEKVEFIFEFNVLAGKYFIIAENRTDQTPVLLYLDPDREKPVMLPAIYGSESSFSDMLADPAHGRTDVVITESNGRIARLQVKSFDPKGQLLHNYFILQQDQRGLLNAEVTPGDSLSKMLVGTYGARDLRYAQGFFTAPVASQIVSGEFYSFLQLQNFYKYMKPRREARTRKRELARIAEGKEPLQRYRLLLHDLITTPTGYVLPAEIYYPQYRSSTGYLDPRFRDTDRAAIAYKRTHAIALGFDKDGILLWDNSFKLEDLSTSELVHSVEPASLPDGRFVIAYAAKDQIHYRVMEQDKYTDEETYIELLPYEKEERITESEQENIVRWYDSHFAAYGFQRIKSPNAPNRMVFYINKISF